jgi:hypothetical protein
LEVTPEEEEEIIRRVADKINEYGMNAAAVLMLQTFKPMAYIGGQMGRFFLCPLLYGLGDKISIGAERLFAVLENRDNLEKLIRMLEQRAEEGEAKRREEEEKRGEGREAEGFKGRFRRFLGL